MNTVTERDVEEFGMAQVKQEGTSMSIDPEMTLAEAKALDANLPKEHYFEIPITCATAALIAEMLDSFGVAGGCPQAVQEFAAALWEHSRGWGGK